VSLFDFTEISLESAMRGAGLRQQVLANNIANANTPGYVRQDVDFHSALRAAMDGGDPAQAQFDVQTDGSAVTADGNGVDIDRENAYLAQNALEYESLAQVARGRIDILLAAMGASS